MHNVEQLKARLSELHQAVDTRLKACERGEITGKALGQYVDKAETEANEIKATIKSLQNAKKLTMAGAPESGNPGNTGPSPDAGDGSRMATKKHHMPSPLDLSQEQLKSLYVAGRDRLPSYSTIVGDDVRTKALDATGLVTKADPAPIAEGSPGSLIPPTLLPQGYPLRYPQPRIADYLLGAAATGQAVSWLQHSSNLRPAAAVAELAEKPDLAPQIIARETHFSVIAGMAYVSRQMFEDFPSLADWLPHELHNAVVNAENDQLLNGNGTAPNQLGLLNTGEALSRTFNPGGSDTQIDCLRKAFNTLRKGDAYCDPDLVVLHPDTWTEIQLLKTTFNSYVLRPDDPNSIAGIDNVFGVRVLATPQCPVDKAVVLDTKIAGTVWVRTGMEILSNWQGDFAFTHNAWAFRAEERIGLGIQYPAAVLVVDGLAGTGS